MIKGGGGEKMEAAAEKGEKKGVEAGKGKREKRKARGRDRAQDQFRNHSKLVT